MFKKNFSFFMALSFIGAGTLATALLTTNNLSTKGKDATSFPTALSTRTQSDHQEASTPFSAKQVADSNNKFGIDLYNQLIQNDETKNLCFSPYSISTALGMTFAGAKNETKQEMAKVLHIGTTSHHAASRQLHTILTPPSSSNPDFTLSIANKLFVQHDYELLDSFIKTMNSYYGAAFQSINFSNNQNASNTINSWISRETHAMIPTLVSPSDLSPLTKLVLANAIYFKGKWSKPFRPENTYDAPFFVSESSIIDTPMMSQTSTFQYMETSDFQMIELDYQAEATDSSQLSMVVLLPKASDGLPEIESSLSTEFLQNCVSQLKRKKLVVKLPKFSFDASSELKTALQHLGMNKAFDNDEADFSGMTKERELHISKVLHKAVIEVAEEGTKAAAATVVVMNLRTVSYTKTPFPMIFNADHPFLFFIKNKATNTILFMGRMIQPK